LAGLRRVVELAARARAELLSPWPSRLPMTALSQHRSVKGCGAAVRLMCAVGHGLSRLCVRVLAGAWHSLRGPKVGGPTWDEI
jgi:hypothetical protein